MNVMKKENTPLLQAHENDNSHAASVDQASGSSEDPAASPLEVAAADDLQPSTDKHVAHTSAPPAEKGAVGGNFRSRFDEAVSKADSDFAQLSTNQPPNTNQPASTSKSNHNQSTQPLNPFFQGYSFPRYLVMKHQDPSKNIVSENIFKVSNGLKQIVGNNTFEHITTKAMYHSRLLLIEVDEKTTAQKLLGAKKVSDIPVKVEIHQEKNSCKGSIFCIQFRDMSEEEVLDNLASQMVSAVHLVIDPEQKRTGKAILTFASSRLPETIRVGYETGIEVSPYRPRPRQCKKCLRFGHGAKTCRSKQICSKCGESESHNDSDCPNSMSCVNCKQNHPASSKNCPLYKIEEAVINHKIDTNTDFKSAREYVVRMHPLVDEVPSLKAHKESLKPTMAKVVSRSMPNNQQKDQQQTFSAAPTPNSAPDIQNLITQLHVSMSTMLEKQAEENRSHQQAMDQKIGTLVASSQENAAAVREHSLQMTSLEASISQIMSIPFISNQLKTINETEKHGQSENKGPHSSPPSVREPIDSEPTSSSSLKSSPSRELPEYASSLKGEKRRWSGVNSPPDTSTSKGGMDRKSLDNSKPDPKSRRRSGIPHANGKFTPQNTIKHK